VRDAFVFARVLHRLFLSGPFALGVTIFFLIASPTPPNNAGGIQDRSIYEDSIFAKMLRDSGLMDERDYQTYKSLFQHMSNFMKKPNIIGACAASTLMNSRQISQLRTQSKITCHADFILYQCIWM
jgi:deoxyadenosine/deoxycytidine kinase